MAVHKGDKAGNNRRSFMQAAAMLGVGLQTLVRSGDARAAVNDARDAGAAGGALPEMTYRKLGRTGFNASRLIFGCGAALGRQRRDQLLDTAFDSGVNVFDVGSSRYYADAEKNLAPFLSRRRDDVFLISKAMVYLDVAPDEKITTAQARQAVRTWTEQLDESLRNLGQEHVDAYYLMASNNPSIVGSDELYEAFLKAKQAGKVSYWGLSTHQNANNVLATAIANKRFDLAMIAITPGGWYDFEERAIVEESPPMAALTPVLDQAREAGIGLVGMKAGRYLAGRQWLGWGNPEAFDEYYGEPLLTAQLSEFQRSYAFVLEHGLDVVNAGHAEP